MSKTPRQKAVGIDAVMIYARDAEAMSEWYERHLGIETVLESDGNYYGRVTDSEIDKTVHVGIYPAATDNGAPGASVMVNYRVEDLDAAVADLRAAGCTIEGTNDEAYGRFAYLRDLEGNPIELWSPTRGARAAAVEKARGK